MRIQTRLDTREQQFYTYLEHPHKCSSDLSYCTFDHKIGFDFFFLPWYQDLSEQMISNNIQDKKLTSHT